MHFFARRITAVTLAALLAALACFEHALHDVSYVHVHHAGCLLDKLEPCSGKLEACPTGGCCSQRAQGATDLWAKDHPSPAEHDPENCAVCRLLALPQLFEPPQHIFLSDAFVADLVGAVQPSFASRIVTLVPIRGPPVS